MKKMMLSKRFVLAGLIILLALLAGCRQSETGLSTLPRLPLFLFDYDQSEPIQVRERAADEQDGVVMHVHSLSYDVLDGQRVEAYLVKPLGPGPFPGILILHGQGSDRGQLLNQARRLAGQGMASLLITANFGPAGRMEDRDRFSEVIVKLRCAIDLLAARPEVDPDRLGYIGFDDGAAAGAVLAAVDKRLNAYVLMSGRARISTWTGRYAPPESRETYTDMMASIDPIDYIGQAAPAAVFFQYGSLDVEVSPPEALALAQAGSEPKRIRSYDAYHVLPGEAYDDAAEWLDRQLGGD